MDAHLICKEPRIGFEMSLQEAKNLRQSMIRGMAHSYPASDEFMSLLDSIIERAEQNAA